MKLTPNLKFSIMAVLMVCTTQAHGGLSSDVLKVAAKIVHGGEISAATSEHSVQAMTSAFKASEKGIGDAFVVVKQGGQVGFGIFEPTILLRRGLYTGFEMQPKNRTWISIVIPLEAVQHAMVPGKTGEPALQLTRQFSQLVDDIVSANPLFKLGALNKYSTGSPEKLYQMSFNINMGPLESMRYNSEGILTNGSQAQVYNIPISESDTLQDVLTFIAALDAKFKVVTSLE